MMTFRIPSDEKIVRFWQWFTQNSKDKWISTNTNDIQQIEKQINNRLKSLNRLIIAYIDYDKSSNKFVLTLSADGIEQVFEAVDKIMDKAPKLTNWNFIKYRQPQTPPDVIILNQKRYELNNIYFYLTPNSEQPLLFDLTIYIQDYDTGQYYQVLSVLFKLIENLIGEYKAVKHINKIDIKPLTDASQKTFPIKNLLQHLDKLIAEP